MRIQTYLFVLVSTLTLSVMVGYFRDLERNLARLSGDVVVSVNHLEETAAHYADRLLHEAVSTWEVDEGQAATYYLDGKNAQGERVIQLVFDRGTGILRTIVCVVNDGTPMREFTGRSPREMADFWVRRLGEANENPYRFRREGKPGKARYYSVWESPARSLSVALNPRTGQLLTLHFDTPTPLSSPGNAPKSRSR